MSEVDPVLASQVAAIAAQVAAQAQASAQYIALLTTVQVIVQTLGVLGVGMIGVWQFLLKRAMEQLERNTNSKMDELLEVTAESSQAKGNLQGRAELEEERKRNV